MFRHVLLRSWLLLLLLLAACGSPDAVAPPTPAQPPVAPPPAQPPVSPPPVSPPAASPIALPPASTPPTNTLTLIATPTPIATSTPTNTVALLQGAPDEVRLDPTLEAKCRTPGYDSLPECLAQTVALPTPPALPFEQALRRFNRRALLYAKSPGFLLLGDPDSGERLWINGAFCPPRRTRDVYGEWSADRRFIAFICQDVAYNAALYLLDMQTAAGRQIAQGDAVDFAWSPIGHRLLGARQGGGPGGFLLDAKTGAMIALPEAPQWENQGYPAPLVGQAVPNGGWFIESNPAAMAWSPDGSRIAVIADRTYVFDADAADMSAGKISQIASFSISSISRPSWSRDGRFLYIAVPHRNHNDLLAPSSMWGVANLRIEVSTGVITDSFLFEPL